MDHVYLLRAKPGKCGLCIFVRGIEFASYYDLSIGLWNCSDNISIFPFFILFLLETFHFDKFSNYIPVPVTQVVIPSSVNGILQFPEDCKTGYYN